MTIHIEALTFDVIIGLMDFERDRPQTVIVDLTANYDYIDDAYIDYADIVILIQDELKSKRYELLENALIGLQTRLYTTYPQLKTLSLKITKPDILSACHVALSHHWEF